MNLFEQALKEAVDDIVKLNIETEEPKEETPDVPEEEQEMSDLDGPDEGEEPTEETESPKVEELRQLVDSILDALEQEQLAQGETIEEDESPDIALEIISKIAPELKEETLQLVIDQLTEYFEISVDESDLGGDEESEEDYEEEELSDLDSDEYEEDKSK